MLSFTLSCVCYIFNGHGSQSLHGKHLNTLVTDITAQITWSDSSSNTFSLDGVPHKYLNVFSFSSLYMI